MSNTTPNGSLPPAQDGNDPARRLDLSGAQVGASALSAVTAAIGASIFGVGGTVGGAAFGAVVSTVAGAVYTHSLSRAGDRLKESQVLVRRVPAAGAPRNPAATPATPPAVAPATTPLATDPEATRPLSRSMERPGEDLAEPVTIALPGPEAVDATRVMAPVAPEPVYAGESRTAPQARLTGPDGRRRPPIHKRRPLLVLAAIAAAGFAIALGVITFIEVVIDRPVSGGTGGTSLGQVVGGSGSTDEPTSQVTDEPTDEPTEGPAEEPTSEVTQEPTEEPTEEPDEQQPEPTDGPADGDGSVDPTG